MWGFDGRQSPEGVATAMSAATAVVVPSRMEAFGIVALEAWRAGTTLVMTDRGGASEFVTHDEDGLLIDPEDTLRSRERSRTSWPTKSARSTRGRWRTPGSRVHMGSCRERVRVGLSLTTRLPADR